MHMHVHLHVHIHAYSVHIYIYMHICIYIYIYIYLFICCYVTIKLRIEVVKNQTAWEGRMRHLQLGRRPLDGGNAPEARKELPKAVMEIDFW